MKRLGKRQFAEAARRGAVPRVLLLFGLVITLCGCDFVPRKWYLSTLEYYQDGWYGSQTKIDYLVYQSDNTFLHVDGGSQPGKCGLTEF